MATRKSVTKKLKAKTAPSKKAASKKISAKKSPGKKAPLKKSQQKKQHLIKIKGEAKVKKPCQKALCRQMNLMKFLMMLIVCACKKNRAESFTTSNSRKAVGFRLLQFHFLRKKFVKMRVVKSSSTNNKYLYD